MKILSKTAGYERIILDAYWEPGADGDHPELFVSTFRVDCFFFAFYPILEDLYGNECIRFFQSRIGNIDNLFTDFDTFFDFMKTTIVQGHQNGSVALKSAIAYHRGLDFELVSESKARGIFAKGRGNYNCEEIKLLQDYVFIRACEIAAELDIPFQVHTGLGRLQKSNAYQLQPVIEANPKTKFVVMHGSYPWLDDVLGLVHVYPVNVFPDLVWLPLISREAAIRMTSELIEVTNANSICWGDDAWTSEEAYASLLATHDVLSTVLSAKIENGYMSPTDAFEVANKILRDNAARLYKL